MAHIYFFIFYHVYFFQFWTIRKLGHVTIPRPGHVTVPGCISWDGIFYCCFSVGMQEGPLALKHLRVSWFCRPWPGRTWWAAGCIAHCWRTRQAWPSSKAADIAGSWLQWVPTVRKQYVVSHGLGILQVAVVVPYGLSLLASHGDSPGHTTVTGKGPWGAFPRSSPGPYNFSPVRMPSSVPSSKVSRGISRAWSTATWQLTESAN